MIEELLSKKRFYNFEKIVKDNNEADYRSSFQKDYDRLIFSNSFRRLSRKTQVHPLSANDHVHNRLTHSLEVASVGRSLGLQCGKMLKAQYPTEEIEPYDVAYIIQTACLAHDIGNPPFGHAGEEVIKEWFNTHADTEFLNSLKPEEISDFQHFDGNAQSLRIVSKIENNLSLGGMRLTFATLGALVKYPYSSNECKKNGRSKFNCFQSEKEFFDILFTELGLKRDDGSYKRHIFSYLMEAADDICYGLLDLQDAIELEIITIDDVKVIFSLLCDSIEVEAIYGNDALSDIKKVSKLVAKAIDSLAVHTMEVFKANYEALMGDQQPKDLISLFSDAALKKGIEDAKRLGHEKIFNEHRKIELELGAYNIIETILDNLIKATFELYQKDENSLSFRNKRALALMGGDKPEKSTDLFQMYQSVTDYLVGMTDNHAKYVASQLNGMGI
ncbi:MAG: deoxyguanosinetriphosphate triphosphohydrolase [Methylococcaceae bacterium]|nr:deoxyguanosinetriphosphate triphosphohydrolase [Methylococcaceae bacterium]